MNVALLYLSHLGYGGWLSYTVHMYRAFEQQGHNVKLVKAGNNTEKKHRPYGYGVDYQNVSREDFIKVYEWADVVIVTALGKKLYDTLPYLKAGTILVVHDHTEITPELMEHIDKFKVVAIREAPNKLIQTKGVASVFIPHPYVSPYASADIRDEISRNGAAAISRLDFDKRTVMICQANDKMPKKYQVRIHGDPGNLWARAMKGKMLDWRKYWHGRFSRNFEAVQEILVGANYCVDLSIIKGDGGGSQYSFLEAWDAHTPLVVHRTWLAIPGELEEGVNCYAVESADELVAFLKGERDTATVAANAYSLLAKHEAKEVVPRFLELV